MWLRRCLKVGKGLSTKRERPKIFQDIKSHFAKNRTITEQHRRALQSAERLFSTITNPTSCVFSTSFQDLRTLATVIKPTESLTLKLLDIAKQREDITSVQSLWYETLSLKISPKRFIFSTVFSLVKKTASLETLRKLFDDWTTNVFYEDQKPIIVAQQFLPEFEKYKDTLSIHQLLNFMISKKHTDLPFLVSYVQTCRRLGDSSDTIMTLWNHVISTRPGPSEALVGSLAALAAETGQIELTRSIQDFLFSPNCTLKMKGTVYGLLMTGLVKKELMNEGLSLLQNMYQKKIHSGGHPYTLLLSLAGKISSLHYGELVMELYLKSGLRDFVVETALIDMFGKCGDPEKATKAFMNVRAQIMPDITTWTAYLLSLALNGRSLEALSVFEEIKTSGLVPNRLTVTTALQACSHGGLVPEAKKIWVEYSHLSDETMLNCMVDVLSRSGYLEDAEALLRTNSNNNNNKNNKKNNSNNDSNSSSSNNSNSNSNNNNNNNNSNNDSNSSNSSSSNSNSNNNSNNASNNNGGTVSIVGLKTILGACRTQLDVPRAIRIGNELISRDPQDASVYVALSNIFDACDMKEERAYIRNLKERNSAHKLPGQTCIEIDGKIHSFIAADNSHPMYLEIRKQLKKVAEDLTSRGHIFDTSWCTSSHVITEAEKIDALCQHSEKLAICFGLLVTPSGTTLRLTKNLRVCGDCHAATKHISALYKREIVMRDKSRFHHFKEGKCSCNDFF